MRELSSPDSAPPALSTSGGETPKIARWSAAECPFAIDYPVELLNRIRQRAVESLHTVRGGLEIGGLLFGRLYPTARAPLRLELVTERPIECAHVAGPAFVLSEEDRAQLAHTFAQTRTDPEISGLSVAGLWLSHTRSGLALTPDDLELYNLSFPQNWQIALVVKPMGGQPTLATFFFRNGGHVAPHLPGHEFFADPHLAAATVPATPERSARYVPLAKEPRPEAAALAAIPESSPPRPKIPLPAAAALIAILSAGLTAGVMSYLRGPLQVPVVAAHEPELQLEAFEAGSAILIHWNVRSAEVRNAQSGTLIIRDGEKEQGYPLSLAALQTGFRRYTPANPNPQVTLRLDRRDGTTVQSTAVYPPAAQLP